MDWSSKLIAYLNLGATESATRGPLLASIGTGVQAAIEKRTGRTWEPVVYTDTLDGNGRRMLYLPHDPVLEVTAVTLDSSDVLSRIVVSDRAGLVFTDGSLWSPGVANVSVTYRAGYSEPPDDLVEAGVRWAAMIFRQRDRIGVSSSGVVGQSTSFTEELPPWVREAVNAHVRWDRPC